MNEHTETFSAQEIQGIISFGVSLGTRIALGINIKAVFSSIAPEIIDVQSGKGIGWDIDINHVDGILELFSKISNINQEDYNEMTKRAFVFAKHFSEDQELINQNKNLFL